ncbi:ureidoglycolate lyase [Leptolyngbya sp. BL0902]|uniref:ureidoglycolate lyase n=1 Tax=Leptolyngbya sp. BL0902 TaxID=1115757 RepID=UPI0018E78EA8|nr:ureidoglycolate lyase [Leptolyngbya sp. BL0902]
MSVSSPPRSQRLLVVEPITAEAFAPYGQVIFPNTDGAPFGPADAQLVLNQGIPRFYLMTLTHAGTEFHALTRHRRCTQCLGALANQDWLIAVAPPSEADQPDLSALKGFHIPGHCFIKLAVGTWHAGPYFTQPSVTFYNLELSDTNLTDHQTCNLAQTFGLSFVLKAR